MTDARLKQDLMDAFQQHGVNDPWLVEQLADSIHDRQRGASSTSDQLVADVLTASGYSDVAATFTRARGQNPLDAAFATLTPCDDARLRQVIANALPLTAAQLDTILPACQSALRKLRLQDVSDDFLAALALHLLANSREARRQRRTRHPLPAPQAPAPLLPLDLDRDLLAPEIRERLQHGVILITESHVAISLVAHCHHYMDDWPSELTFATTFPATARAACELLQARPDLPRAIAVHELTQLFPTARHHRNDRLAEQIRASLAHCADSPLDITLD